MGDMFEIGKDTMLEHQKIVDQLTAIGLDKTYLIGDAFFNTKGSNDTIYKESSFIDTTFLIKASRGMALERTLDFF